MIHLGMDVHKESITIAVLSGDAKTPTRLSRHVSGGRNSSKHHLDMRDDVQ